MIEIKDLCVNYGAKTVYENFNLTAESGKVTCILGESGCGKTTLLNAVASLIAYKGNITPVKATYVFQTPRLLPHISVIKNLTLAGADEQEAKVALDKVGLGGREYDFPVHLSGGEEQRVSLLRAFLCKSEVILMDEPFSSLDLKTKLSAMDLFENLHKADARTTLFVTHDIDEAVYLGDRIAVIENGKIKGDFLNESHRPFGENTPLREEIISKLLK